jgi:tungstate transport system substrate-binding protein
MKRRLFILVAAAALILSFSLFAGAAETITLATTTSTYDTGLLDAILPVFTKATGIEVKVVSAGTGKALEYGKNGDADIVLVHARSSEDKFVAEGYGIDRKDVMYNNFLLIGPKEDPAKIKGMKDVVAAFKKIAEKEAPFVSRGDKSGTNVKELEIWKAAGITPSGDWYLMSGVGMGQTLIVANEKGAYTLSDDGTYYDYTLGKKIDLPVMVEGDKVLFNQYGIILVNPAKVPTVKYDAAKKLHDWMTGPDGQKEIAKFKKYGKQLFFPNAPK